MITVVVQQMLTIFVLIAFGVFLYRSGHLTKSSTKDVSWIVVNVTNPITMLVAALEDDQKVDIKTLGIALFYILLVYVLLGIIGYFIPIIMGVEKDARYSYRFLSVFANVGFIGIPFCSAVLGVHSLIYVTITILVFNLIFYTIGIKAMDSVGSMQHPEKKENGGKISKLGMINAGTVLSLVTISIYLMDFNMPPVIDATLKHAGRSTTFLSMLVLGVSVAQAEFKNIFNKWRLYVFVVLRQILVPIVVYFIIRPFTTNDMMLTTIVMLTAMPCANLPLMTAKQFDVEEGILSSGIMLTTLLSIVTIPIVTLILV